jgi:hypothetical protein
MTEANVRWHRWGNPAPATPKKSRAAMALATAALP